MSDKALWTPQELDYLDDNYQAFKSKHQEAIFLARLAEIAGNRRTAPAVKAKALQRGLTKRDSIGYPIVPELAAELGVKENTLRKFIVNRDLEVVKTTHYTFVPPETQAVIESFYGQVSPDALEGTITTKEASRRLFVSQREIPKLIKFGILEGIRYRATWRVTKQSLYRAMSLRNIHGTYWLSKIRESLTPDYEKDRAYTRNYQRLTKRKAQQQALVLAIAPVQTTQQALKKVHPHAHLHP